MDRLLEWRQEHPAGGRPVKTARRFLSAPHVPMAWIAAAIKVRALPLAIGILYLKGLHKADGRPFPVSTRMLKPWGITKAMKTKGLPKLAAAGLIDIENRPNASPMVTVLRGPLEPGSRAPMTRFHDDSQSPAPSESWRALRRDPRRGSAFDTQRPVGDAAS